MRILPQEVACCADCPMITGDITVRGDMKCTLANVRVDDDVLHKYHPQCPLEEVDPGAMERLLAEVESLTKACEYSKVQAEQQEARAKKLFSSLLKVVEVASEHVKFGTFMCPQCSLGVPGVRLGEGYVLFQCPKCGEFSGPE